jgi:hypothetical protein
LVVKEGKKEQGKNPQHHPYQLLFYIIIFVAKIFERLDHSRVINHNQTKH